MTDYKTLRVSEEQYHEAKEQKEKNDRTWGEQLVCNNDSTTAEQVNVVDVDKIREAIQKDRQAQLEEVVHGSTMDAATTEDIADLVEEINSLSKRLTDSKSVTLDATERKKIAEAIAEELR